MCQPCYTLFAQVAWELEKIKIPFQKDFTCGLLFVAKSSFILSEAIRIAWEP